MKKLLLVALACAGVGSVALGQTGRIAHFSHAGSVGALVLGEATADNFGDPAPYFVPDSVRYLSASKLVWYGKWHFSQNRATTDTVRLPKKMSAAEAGRYLDYKNNPYYERLKLIGFDSSSYPAQQPYKLEGKTKKPTNRTQTFSKRPFQYSYWRGLATVVALGTVGWLLGKKRPA